MKRFHITRLLAMLLTLCMLLPLGIIADSGTSASDNYQYNIVHLDCGRKYFSVENIKKLIDTMSGAGFTHLELAVGNDGMRFLLDDMSLTVNGTTYTSAKIKEGIQAGNKTYYNEPGGKNELTEAEMDEIISYAFGKGIEIIPLINTPGHMDSIQNCIENATGLTNIAYASSDRTIDVTNSTAVAFTKAFLQKYITYFASKGCTVFNMGADEYANDKLSSGGMGFGNLISTGKYGSFVTYVNEVAAMIKAAGMRPMAFNDGIYYNRNTSYGTFDTDILISYWSNGWSGYSPAGSSFLRNKGFDLVNTNGSYYWVLGKSDAQCSVSKASGFTYTAFPDGTISDPAGSMFAIWCDYPDADTDTNVIANTQAVVTAFGGALPERAKQMNTVRTKDETISVTGYDLESVTAEPASAPAVPNAEKVACWDLTPVTTSGSKYEGSAVVSVKIPDGWDTNATIRAFCINDDSTLTLGIPGTVKDGYFTFTATHFSQWGIYQVQAGAVEVTENRTITVVKGGTATDIIDGADYSGTYAPAAPAMANVTAAGHTTEPKHYYQLVTNGVNGIKAGEKYLIVSARSGSAYALTRTGGSSSVTISNGQIATAAANTVFTLEANGTGYNLKDTNGTYLYPDATYDDSYFWGSWDYSLTSQSSTAQAVTMTGTSYVRISRSVSSGSGWGASSTTSYLRYNSGFSASSSSSTSNLYLFREVEESGENYTEVTFEGLETGTTTVTVGHVFYTIHVTEEDLENASDLTVEFWITNRPVGCPTKTDPTSKALTADKAYGEKGVEVKSLLPMAGVDTEDSKDVVYWKTTRLTSANKQTTGGGVDKTTSGDDLTYIRYYGGKWSFSADGKTWKDFASTDQVVAYYLQVTEVTDEVTTEVVDWGNSPSELGWLNGDFVILDFAVKFPTGDMKPDKFQNDKTLAFHCQSGEVDDDGNSYRSLGAILAVENSNYEVYMITVKPNSDRPSEAYGVATTISAVGTYTYEGTEKVIWVDDEQNLGDFADESLRADGYHVGGAATVPGLAIYKRHAMLITYYLRAKQTKDSLTVHYIDRSSGDKEFYRYNIAVKENTFFDPNFRWVSNNVLAGNTVENFDGYMQTVSTDLSTMPEIGAQYRYSKYVCVYAERSADGKDVYLYYTFTDAKTVVADFGLPLDLKLTEINPEFANATITGVKVFLSKAGSPAKVIAVKNASGEWVITYTLTGILKGIDTIQVEVTGTLNNISSTVTWNVYVVPATNVHYEESFFDYSGDWKDAGTAKTPSQSSDNKDYGFDIAYDNSDDFSMGNAKLAYITEKNVKAADCPSATFTFTGTGFDIISACGSNTGVLYVRYKRTDGVGKAHVIIVDTYFSGNFVSNGNGSVNRDTVHQIPVVSKTGLEYGEYEVTVYAYYLKTSGAVVARKAQALKENPDSAENFELGAEDILVYLDGIRVYNPMGTALDSGAAHDAYAEAKELNPEYASLYDALKQNGSNWNESESSFIYLEKPDNAEVSDSDYQIGFYQENKGPHNEIYIAPGSAIAFRVNGTGELLAVSAKAISGTTAMKINGTKTYTVTSMSELYYAVTPDENGVVVIENTGDAILSVVKLKLVGYTVAEADNAAKQELVETVNLLLAKAEEDVTPTEPAKPETPAKPERPSEGKKPTFRPDHFRFSFGTERRRSESRAFFTVRTSMEVTGVLVNGTLVTDSAVENGYKVFRVELTLVGSSGVDMLVGRTGRLLVTTDEYSHRKYLNSVASRTEVVTVAAVKDDAVGEAQTVAVRY